MNSYRLLAVICSLAVIAGGVLMVVYNNLWWMGFSLCGFFLAMYFEEVAKK